MTITFDPIQQRSTNVESGVAVQWLRNEPPMERQTHFKLIVEGSETPFAGTYDNGWSKLQQKYPEADAVELHRKVSALRHLDYSASNIKARFDADVFVRVWQDLMAKRLPGYRISTHYVEFRGGDPANKKEWSCEG
jgi:hypothetical protein